jgi:hypothetical protein
VIAAVAVAAGLAVLAISVLGGDTKAGAIEFEPFTDSKQFTVEVPVGWRPDYTDKPLPGQGRGQVRTQLTSRDGEMSMQILREPDTSAQERADTAQTERERDPKYALVELPTPTRLGARDAVLFAYAHDEPEIGRATIYNYLFNDGGFGWRTRVAGASGDDRAANAREIATEAATTLRVTGSS